MHKARGKFTSIQQEQLPPPAHRRRNSLGHPVRCVLHHFPAVFFQAPLRPATCPARKRSARRRTCKSGDWTEQVKDGNTITRYILDGTGTVSISSDNDSTQLSAVGPGTLVEVTGRASLQWSTREEIIVLTPGYEEGRLLLTVALTLIAMTILLISGAGGH